MGGSERTYNNYVPVNLVVFFTIRILLSAQITSAHVSRRELREESVDTVPTPSRQFFSKPGNIVGTVIGVCILLIILVYFFYNPSKLRRGGSLKRKVADIDDQDFLKSLSGVPTRYTYGEVKELTKGFERKLGNGGCGSVYHGRLSNGTEVAVKSLETTSRGESEFRAEISALAGVDHPNVVTLLGFCCDNKDKRHNLLIVHNYMSNGSLEGWVFQKREKTLRWKDRLRVLTDVANGLRFLHNVRETVHLDIKPENILLSEDFQSRICDFGLCAFMKCDERTGGGKRHGTPGYLAPEKEIGYKSDIYSLGVVILETVCGRRCIDLTAKSEDCYLTLAALRRMQSDKERVLDIVDCRIRDEVTEEEVKRVLQIALMCVVDDPFRRPEAGDVCMLLGAHEFKEDSAI